VNRKPREDVSKTEIRRYLRSIRPDEGFFWTTPVSTYGASGVSDQTGVFRGWSVAIEIKRRDGGVLTKNQIDFLKRHQRAGGVSIIARSASEVQSRLESLPWRERPAAPRAGA